MNAVHVLAFMAMGLHESDATLAAQLIDYNGARPLPMVVGMFRSAVPVYQATGVLIPRGLSQLNRVFERVFVCRGAEWIAEAVFRPEPPIQLWTTKAGFLDTKVPPEWFV